MGRIKKEHDGWKSSGLWQKFQYPKIDDDVSPVIKSKKDTNKWCRGRVGVPHVKYLTERHKWWLWTSETYVCKYCKKTFHKTTR